MKVVAGIDEAGYGPSFGPLVLSASVFRIPEGGEEDIWKLLAASVTKKSERNSCRILVNDSKKVFGGRGRIRALERGVLSFLRCCTESMSSLSDVLKRFSLEDDLGLDELPWYEDFHVTLPVDSAPEEIEDCSENLRRDIACSPLEFLGVKTLPVEVPRLNSDFRRTDNKAASLFEYTLKFIDYLRKTYGKEKLEFVIDKHGGRRRYARLLAGSCWGDRVRIISQDKLESTYELSGKLGRARISFREKADELSFPVALASMVSKYVRELYMILFNRYWKKLAADVKPTSGYYEDARRFIAHIEPLLVRQKIDTALLIRSR